jgi:hypothetical protein
MEEECGTTDKTVLSPIELFKLSLPELFKVKEKLLEDKVLQDFRDFSGSVSQLEKRFHVKNGTLFQIFLKGFDGKTLGSSLSFEFASHLLLQVVSFWNEMNLQALQKEIEYESSKKIPNRRISW